MKIANHIQSVLLLCATIIFSLESNAQELYPDSLFSKYPYIVVLSDTDTLPPISDEQFYTSSGTVTFKVGKTKFDSKSKLIHALETEIIPIINRDSLELCYMMVRGSASPEGSTSHNNYLGQKRAEELLNYINSRLRYPLASKDCIKNSVSEDYQYLCYLMSQAHDPQAEVVRELVERYTKLNNFEDLKYILRHANNSELWNRMLTVYFPKLRAARLILFLRKYDPSNGQIVVSTQQEFESKALADTDTVPQPDSLQSSTLDGICHTDLQLEQPDILPSVHEQRLVRPRLLAIRTNLLYDFFYMPTHFWAPSPNIQVEFYPRKGHFTANFGFTCPYWSNSSKNQCWQIRDYNFECRYYFKGKARFIGPFVSAYVHTNKYGIGFDNKTGYQGEGLGGGILLGWSLNISKNRRWRLEFTLGAGYYQTKYDPYVYGNPKTNQTDGLYYYDYTGKVENFQKRNHTFRWIGPTNAGIHITYDLLYRRIQKRGISFNRTEKGGGL